MVFLFQLIFFLILIDFEMKMNEKKNLKFLKKVYLFRNKDSRLQGTQIIKNDNLIF